MMLGVVTWSNWRRIEPFVATSEWFERESGGGAEKGAKKERRRTGGKSDVPMNGASAPSLPECVPACWPGGRIHLTTCQPGKKEREGPPPLFLGYFH